MQLSKTEEALWRRFQTAQRLNRFPQALLLVGPVHAMILPFAIKMAGALLCLNQQTRCGLCKACLLAERNEHPDRYLIVPEQAGGMIKIDQIRDLQAVAFTSPQLSERRVVIIYPADRMNTAASNALLKLLEEPPEGLTFLLIAEQLSTVAATIISRCQQWRFSSAEILQENYLKLGEIYDPETERGKLFAQLNEIIESLLNLKDQSIAASALAQKWSDYSLNDLLGLIYLLNSQMIHDQINAEKNQKFPKLNELAQRLSLHVLFKQLDAINAMINKLNQNINVNQLLVLENFLLGYLN